MGRVKEIYSLADECRELNVNLSLDKIIELEENGHLDEILESGYIDDFSIDDYSFEETEELLVG